MAAAAGAGTGSGYPSKGPGFRRRRTAASASIASPRSLTVTFSERVVPAFSGLEVVNAAGAKFPVATTVSDDGMTVSGRTARPLAAGAYSLNWHAASADGHRMTGAIAFTVR